MNTEMKTPASHPMKLVAGLAGARNRAADVQASREIIADSFEAIRQVLTVERTVEKINQLLMPKYCYELILWVLCGGSILRQTITRNKPFNDKNPLIRRVFCYH